jgi:hypothetical protein
VINGISIDTYNSNKTLYGNTLALSIAACMEGVEAANIINLVATGASSSASVAALRGGGAGTRVLASSSAISTSYDVSVRNAALSYDSLSQQLTTAVTTGMFNTYLATYSTTTGASGYEGATSDEVATANLQGGDNDSKKKVAGGVIAGIVLGCLAVILLIAVGLYFSFRHRMGGASSSNGPGPARVDPAVAVAEDGTTRISYVAEDGTTRISYVAEDGTTRISYEDPAATKSKHASVPTATLNPISASR